MFSRNYLIVFSRALDVLLCTWIWRDYDITISSMTGLEMRKAAPKWWARALNWFLNKLQAGHCEKAIVADTVRAQAALAILTGKVNP
jgi:hypothetical protein